MDYVQNLFAERIGGRSFGESDVIYKFEKIKIAKKEAKERFPNIELIDLGVGQPDYMADISIVNRLQKEAEKWENRGYADNGIEEFKLAADRYMECVFGVKGIDADKEVLHMIGSKAALTLIPQAFINPGDITIMTVPGYPVLGTISEWLGGTKYEVPLHEENDFFPDLSSIPEEVCKKAKLFYVNYPNNPTGQVPTREFYEELIHFCKKYGIIIVQDAAYAAVRLDGERPLSILSIEGAKDIAIEVHSLSKSFNMTGWRLGFVVGNRKIVSALATVKDNFDAGQFKAIQIAGSYALDHPELTEQMNQIYRRRQKKLAGVLREFGFQAKESKGTFYMYMKAPRGTEEGLVFKDAEAFSQYLIREKVISVVPWDDAGNYVRFSVTFTAADETEEDRVIVEVRKRLSGSRYVF